MFKNWKENQKDLDINEKDHLGRSALFLVCYKGYSGPEGITAKTPLTNKKRLECIEILIKEGADINFATKKLNMTALHWAAYQSQLAIVRFLLQEGAKLQMNQLGDTPIDVAGYCGEKEIVEVFLRQMKTSKRLN